MIIQHHDSIVTALDLGLALNCQYDLSNRTILNDFDLVRFFCRFFSKMLRILEKRTKTKIKFIFIYVSVCHGHKLSFFKNPIEQNDVPLCQFIYQKWQHMFDLKNESPL